MDILYIHVLIINLICLINGQANIAIGQPTNHLADLDWAEFLWTSDKAVDGCLDRDIPDTQQCCSSSVGAADNFWRVDLSQPAILDRAVVYGRNDGQGGDQLSGFLLSITPTSGGQEKLVYSNVDVAYGQGMFTIPMNGEQVASVIIRRPTGTILTLCEVELYTATTTPMSSPSTALTTSAAPTPSTSSAALTTSTTAPTGATQTTRTTMASSSMPQSTATTSMSATGSVSTQATTASPGTGDGNGGGRLSTDISAVVAIFLLWKSLTLVLP